MCVIEIIGGQTVVSNLVIYHYNSLVLNGSLAWNSTSDIELWLDIYYDGVDWHVTPVTTATPNPEHQYYILGKINSNGVISQYQQGVLQISDRYRSLDMNRDISTLVNTFAPLSMGVTNGDQHTHYNNDGGTIDYNSLGNLPVINNATSLHGRAIATTTPANDQALCWSEVNSEWVPKTVATSGGGGGGMWTFIERTNLDMNDVPSSTIIATYRQTTGYLKPERFKIEGQYSMSSQIWNGTYPINISLKLRINEDDWHSAYAVRDICYYGATQTITNYRTNGFILCNEIHNQVMAGASLRFGCEFDPYWSGMLKGWFQSSGSSYRNPDVMETHEYNQQYCYAWSALYQLDVVVEFTPVAGSVEYGDTVKSYGYIDLYKLSN